MARPDLSVVVGLLRTTGYELVKVVDEPMSFGSWYVIAKGRRRRFRLVWDGREGQASIQAPRTDDAAPGGPDWIHLWSADRPDEQTAEAMLAALTDLGPA